MLTAVPAALRTREMGVILTLDAAGGGPQVTAPGQEAWRWLPYVMWPRLAGLTTAAKKGRRNQITSRCNLLWKELEMGLWMKILAEDLNSSVAQS